jgi:ribosomal-protein-alanine N-acetyltransferase
MSAVIREISTKTMPFAVRPLREGDISQAKAVEKNAFPILFPPTSFRCELQNRVAQYWIAEKNPTTKETFEGKDAPANSTSNEHQNNALRTIVGRARNFWNRQAYDNANRSNLVGFLGIWYIVDEAHIVSVGIHSDYLRRGIGELLLIVGIEHAIAKQTETMTLEVRKSNMAAQALYGKYGFTERGVRKAYYSDNREDAIIMTTESIQTTLYAEQLLALKQAHQERWGIAEVEIGI